MTTVEEFVVLLRRVRDRSGLSYRTIAKRAELAGAVLPASTLATMLTRRTLPRRELVSAVLAACEVPPGAIRHWLDVWGRLAERADDASADEEDGGAAIGPVPFQLPPPPPALVGRGAELDLLAAGLAEPPGAWLLTGAGGVGKSALAVLSAHRAGGRYPGGCLYVDLRGASAEGAPSEPYDVLLGFLRALGVRMAPGTVDEASALFRSITADRAMLVVLDNAGSAAQVRPLLPSGPRSTTLVTSRWRLPDLDVTGRLAVEPLPAAGGRALLAHLCGAGRVTAEAAAAADIVRLCGGSPLALRIVGARAASRQVPGTLGVLAQHLGDDARHLDALEVGDLSVRAGLRVGYRSLVDVDATAATLFRLAAVPDWIELSVDACAVMLDAPAVTVDRALDLLIDAHLVEGTAPGRFRYHDSVRIFARELAAASDPADAQLAARSRLVSVMFSAAAGAARTLFPHDTLPYGELGATPQRLIRADATTAEAWQWLELERVNLRMLAGQELAAGNCLPAIRDLGVAVAKYLDYAGHFVDQARLGQIAIDAARRLGDRSGTAQALNMLAIAMLRHERRGEGIALLDQALVIRRELGDRAGEAACLNNLGNAHRDDGDLDAALGCLQQSLALRKELSDRYKTGSALDNIGIVLRRMGRYQEALDHHRAGLAITRELDDRLREALVLTNLAETEHLAGQPRQALGHAEQALSISRELHHDRGRGLALQVMGDVWTTLGQPARGRACHDEAAELLHEPAIGAPTPIAG
ncbi:tetratricopeptide repeat protein [Asanoa iriomotensis]|uniref:tetratricopeptide repeat protein n=1 Tax=Asanoa iriomotensis TaxID=234613 RepID=UPI001943023F|nr:tetratricopeptide repeat protein [Asanoa iriomotensis]